MAMTAEAHLNMKQVRKTETNVRAADIGYRDRQLSKAKRNSVLLHSDLHTETRDTCVLNKDSHSESSVSNENKSRGNFTPDSMGTMYDRISPPAIRFLEVYAAAL
jgi:hypothetical protein